MRMYLKKYIVMLVLCFVAVTGVFVHATDVMAAISSVYDEAGLLSEAECEELLEQVNALCEKTSWNIFAVTTADAHGKSSMEYADDFYDEQTSKDADGVLVLIDMDNREIYISTCGIAIRYLEDTRIEAILDDAFYYVADGAYAECLSAMISGVEYYYDKGIHQDQYNYDVETGEISEYVEDTEDTLFDTGYGIYFSIGVGLAFYFIIIDRYSLKGSTRNDGYDFTRYGKVDLIDREDRFMHKTLTHQVIKRDDDHQSSTHTSSSGSTHGGGGRSF